MKSIEFDNGARAEATELKDCYIIKPKFFGDERGYYVADYIKEDDELLNFKSVVSHTELKSEKNILRKMQFDKANANSSRIIRTITGDGLAIIIDGREGSKTFGEHTLVHLTPYTKMDENSGKEVLIPEGFVYGILSLNDNTIVQEFISSKCENSIKISLSEDEANKIFDDVLSQLTTNKDKIVTLKDNSYVTALEITPTELQDAFMIKPYYAKDIGGYVVNDFVLEKLKRFGFDSVYQHSESKSAKNVLRGMHFQLDPKCQAKLVRVVQGEVIDVIVDIRVGSPTYGKSIAVHLKPYDENDPMSGYELFVPRGFAHGFISLTDDAVFQYFVDNSYAPELEEGILWSGDETKELFESVLEEHDINLDELVISAKDKVRLPLSEKPQYFEYKEKTKTLEYSFEVGM